MAAPATNLSTGMLLLACGVLGAVVVAELNGEVPLAPQVTAAAPTAPEVPRPEPIAYVPPPPDSFADIALRPLFSPSRRPYEPEPEAEPEPEVAVEPEAAPLAAELRGVLLSGQRQAALLEAAGSGAAIWLHVGQTLDGWRLESVARDRAVLSSGERVEILELHPY